MESPLKKVVGWIADALVDKITEPIERMEKRLDGMDKRLDELKSLHEQDAAALEADLSMMDDRICRIIGVCRQRGYTTAEDRRRVGRMHRAYHARGGNDGETEEYAIFSRLPTEEEWHQTRSAE